MNMAYELKNHETAVERRLSNFYQIDLVVDIFLE